VEEAWFRLILKFIKTLSQNMNLRQIIDYWLFLQVKLTNKTQSPYFTDTLSVFVSLFYTSTLLLNQFSTSANCPQLPAMHFAWDIVNGDKIVNDTPGLKTLPVNPETCHKTQNLLHGKMLPPMFIDFDRLINLCIIHNVIFQHNQTEREKWFFDPCRFKSFDMVVEQSAK
jgi:hypothetical protein